MKRLFFVFFSACIVFGKSFASVPIEENFIKNYTLGFELNNYRYIEPDFISHSGFMLGVYGEMTWLYLPNLLGVTSGKLNFGELDYDGALCDVNTNECTEYKAKTVDVITRVTHRFDYLATENLGFFLGLGYRLLIDRGRGEGFYTRTGSYLFLPLGFHFNFQNINFDFEYDVLISGSMKSNLSEVNKTFRDIRLKQSAGSGFKITLTRQFDILAAQPLLATIYFENWTFDASNREVILINNQPSDFIEPKNFSQMLGLQLGLLF